MTEILAVSTTTYNHIQCSGLWAFREMAVFNVNINTITVSAKYKDFLLLLHLILQIKETHLYHFPQNPQATILS